MPVPRREPLSASTDGDLITIAATSTPGTNLHTAPAIGYDLVWLYAYNVTDDPVKLTVEWAGTDDPGDHAPHEFTIPPNSLGVPIATGDYLGGSKAIAAFADTASAINIKGAIIAVR